MSLCLRILSRSIEEASTCGCGNLVETHLINSHVHLPVAEVHLDGAVVVESEYLCGLAVLLLRP